MSNGNETKALATLPLAVQTRAAAVTVEQAEAMMPAIQAVWPKDVAANPVLQRMMARVCIAYGFDPLMGEVMILGTKLYITYEGRQRKAQEREEYGGLECRPATDEERAAFRCHETDHLWRAEVYRRDWKRPVLGWGRVTANDSNPIARQHPQNVAEKRAKARALRDAFSIPLPSAEDAADYNPAGARYVDAETGEITDTRTGGMLANRGQIAAVHALCKLLEIEEADRHDHLRRMFRKAATNELTEGEGAAYLEWLGNLQDERENNRPEVIEAKRRDATPLTVPHAASPRFHTQPAAAVVEHVPMETAEPEPPQPVEEAETPALGTAMPEEIAQLLAAAVRQVITGDALAMTPNAGATALRGASNRLKLFPSYADARRRAALLAVLHLAQTGEVAPEATINGQIDRRWLVWLQECADSAIEALGVAADWWLSRQQGEV